MSLTIFEGPDGGGKSTLAQKWFKPGDAALFNHGPYLNRTGQEIVTAYAHDIEYAKTTGRPVIMDRCWVSEFIYGPIMRGEDRIDTSMRQVLETQAKEAHAVLIICLPSFESCRTAYMSRRHLEYLDNEEQLLNVYKGYRRYHRFSERRVVNTFLYDYDKEPDPTEFIAIVEGLRGGA